MTLFTRLPISVAASLPILSESDIAYFSGLEDSAYEHWIFDKGGVGGLTGRVKGKVLTVQSDAPTYAANSLAMMGSVGKGLLTDLIDAAGAKRTVFAVVQDTIAGTSIKVPFGTLDTTGAGTGGLPFFSGTVPTRGVFTTYKGLTNSANSGAVISNATWHFLAISLDAASASKSVTTLVGGQAVNVATSAGPYAHSGRAIALGNGYYLTGHASLMNFAEFGVYDRALTAADLAAVYARSKARMAARGITVV